MTKVMLMLFKKKQDNEDSDDSLSVVSLSVVSLESMEGSAVELGQVELSMENQHNEPPSFPWSHLNFKKTDFERYCFYNDKVVDDHQILDDHFADWENFEILEVSEESYDFLEEILEDEEGGDIDIWETREVLEVSMEYFGGIQREGFRWV
jgi:hypothetical protein